MDRTPGVAKAGAAIVSGALATILIWVLNTYVLPHGGMPEQIDQSIQILVTAAGVYFTPHQMGS